MVTKVSSLILLTLFVFSLSKASTSANTSIIESRTNDHIIDGSFPRNSPEVNNMIPAPIPEMPKATLGGVSSAQSPGTIIGSTWYDGQHRGSMGRMIDWSRHGNPDTMIVHFSWMYMPGPVIFARHYRYDNWNAMSGDFGVEIGLQSVDNFGGFVGIDATEDGRAVIGGQKWEYYDMFTDCHFYWDSLPGASNFYVQSQVPREVAEYGSYPNQQVIWPKFRYQEGSSDTVLHVIALESSAGFNDPKGLYYFRKVGMNESGTWDYPPYIIDTVYMWAHDIGADNDGKVAIVWTANLPCPGDQCDTCSGYECLSFFQMDNDLYYQISNDYGSEWQPRVNVTQGLDGQEGYRPYNDLSALITSSGDLHIVWGARFWPADANSGGQAGLLRGRIFHWSENNPYIRTVHKFEWDQTTCNGGIWQLTASKMTVSECDGRLYVLFVQFNDIPNGVEADCAVVNSPGFPDGAANGDLYLAISDDWGLTWDQARNLTNSRTPGCDSTGGAGGPCDNDNWPSMTRFGTDYVGDFSAAEIITPAGSSDPGNYYLDVHYINDHSPGFIIHNEGFWAEADVRWFRLPCVEPISKPLFSISPGEISYPTWTKHGLQHDIQIVIQNNGNATLNYNIIKEENNGPAGWLSCTNFSDSILCGLNNSDTGLVCLNTGGVVNDPGTIVNLSGRLIFISNAVTSPDTLPISCLVADTLYLPIWDTIHTSCMALTVANTGNFGNMGIGRVNLDYVDYGDCDTTANVYINDGSPVIGYIKGTDTIVNFSMFNTTYINENGLTPLGNHSPTADSGDYVIFESGRLVTHDSLIAVEKAWYAPQPSDSCNFVIERLIIYLNRDTTVTGLRTGEAIDWDIPSDSGFNNGSGFDPNRCLIYQFGGEYNQDDTTECQDNDRRFGGIAFLDRYINGVREQGLPHGAYTADNATWVYPNQSFVPQELYTGMSDTGYTIYNSMHPDSQFVDLHTIMTFDTGLVLTPADTYIYYLALITMQDGTLSDLQNSTDMSKQWYLNHFSVGCCQNRGNVDGQTGPGGPVDVADLTYLVCFLFQGGQPPLCEEEGNVDGITGVAGPIDVADLTYLVAFLFQGGSPPPPC